MATLTLEIPDELYGRLQRRAEWNQRSLDREALDALDRGIVPLAAEEIDEERLRAEVEDYREELAAGGVWMTEEDVDAAIRFGQR